MLSEGIFRRLREYCDAMVERGRIALALYYRKDNNLFLKYCYREALTRVNDLSNELRKEDQMKSFVEHLIIFSQRV